MYQERQSLFWNGPQAAYITSAWTRYLPRPSQINAALFQHNRSGLNAL